MRNLFLLVLIFLNLTAMTTENPKGEIGKNGMVVTAHPEATKIGVEILKRGGNAIDASVAVGFALAVCYPNAGNLGGGGFMVIRLENKEINSIDFREKAPSKANRTMFLDKEGNVIDKLSLYSHLASGVPGSVDGLITAHEKYGKLPFKDLIQPAINLALKGFPITKRQAKEFNELRSDLLKYNEKTSAFTLKEKWNENDILIQPELAHTLELIRDKGRKGFYEGETAQKIANEMSKGKGLISKEDLKNYYSKWRKPLTSNYKNYKIIAMPPPSSGGIALIQLLKMVENQPLSKWKHNSTESIHLITEAERRVYADRAKHLGDKDFYPVPVEKLMNSEYIKTRMKTYNPQKASRSEDIQAGTIAVHESDETTHYSIVDKWHNAVSSTTTLNDSYGSKVIVEGAGFFLNNEMDDFSIKPNTPNMYGLLGGDANAIQPNKRMLSSMTPTIIEKEGKLFMVVGSPGGSRIITSVFQTVINVLEFGMTMQESVNASRFHHQWQPDLIYYEDDAIAKNVKADLQKMGHILKQRTPMGRVDAVLVRPDNQLEGAADWRGDDNAKGY